TIRKHKFGQLIDVLVKIIPVPGFGNYIMYSDIRERKRIEKIIQNQMRELEVKNEEMERFTYTVSHDLRSPLITIQGFASLLVEDIKSGEYKRLESDLARIINASSKMDQLLQDLLELSRVGRMLNPPSNFPLGEVVDEVVELLHGPISISGVNMIVADEFPIVRGDRSRIREVFQNLIENAIKFMGSQTEPQIQIGHSFRNDESIFFVRDNGMGIESHYLEKVFGLFEQLSANNKGTGIGLALVKRIIEFHDGRVWAESGGLNKGSTFFFTLPTPTGKREE
ncbi:MAG: sensor histidine kinase, partial [Ignavibacteriales bacterium]